MNKDITVLIIDDNPGDARLLQEMLSGEKLSSFKTITAARLTEGIEKVIKGGIDIVLLDLSLPDSNGLESFYGFHINLPNIPVIVMTGLDDEHIATTAVRAGAQDYLVKGKVDPEQLAKSIRYAIERNRLNLELRKLREE